MKVGEALKLPEREPEWAERVQERVGVDLKCMYVLHVKCTIHASLNSGIM